MELHLKYFFQDWGHIPEGIGHGLFTPEHFLLLALAALMAILITRSYKRADRRGRIRIRRIIAVVLIAADIFKLIMLHRCGTDISLYLPLEVCSFATYAIVFEAVWPEKKSLEGMLLLIFLPGTVMALLFPVSAGLPLVNFFTWNNTIYHGLIAAYVIARFASGEIRLRYRDLWTSFLKILVMAAAVYVIDTVFDRNYMFLKGTDGNFMLNIIEGVTGKGWPYIAGLIVFAIFILHVFFVIFKVLEKLFIKNENNE